MYALIEERLKNQREQGLYRERRVRPGVIDFSHNDYLGLSQHPKVKEALIAAIEQYGFGSRASAMVSGYTTAHQECEKDFAEFLQRDRALLFNSGYAANLAVLQALINSSDTLFYDRSNHASLMDGARLTEAKIKRYRSIPHLEQLFHSHQNGLPWIITESIFSTDGRQASLKELAQLAHTHQAALIVDEAHGLGVRGPQGRGLLAELGLSQHEVPLAIYPLGKALGGMGAIVAGESRLIEYILQFARPYRYTTLMPPAIAAGLSAGLQILKTDEPQARLHHNIAYFKETSRRYSLSFPEDAFAIQSYALRCIQRAQSIQQGLLDQGFLVGLLRPPTVPPHTALLRITLSAEHTRPQIDGLLETLHHVCQ